MPGQTAPIVTLRPTVHVDGQEHEKITALLLGMRLVEAEAGMSGLELRLSDWASRPSGAAEAAFDDEQIVALGSSIAVYVGEEDAPQEIFQCKVTAIEYIQGGKSPPEIALHAE